MTEIKIFFVRVKHNRVSVGIFACRRRQLVDLVDHFVDPDYCEYRRLPVGGFKFGGEVDLSVPFDHESPDQPEFNNIDLTDGWHDGVRASDEDLGDWQDVWPRKTTSGGPAR